MKYLGWILAGALAGVITCLLLRKPCPPDGYRLIRQSEIDSINTIASRPPVVRVDTIIIRDTLIKIVNKPLPEPATIDSVTTAYYDSLIGPDVHVYISDLIAGRLLSRQWAYRPIIRQITIDSTIYVPQIVTIGNYRPIGGIYPSIGVIYINKVYPAIGMTYIHGGLSISAQSSSVESRLLLGLQVGFRF